MDTALPIYEHGFDQETLDDFQELRRLRRAIAAQQLLDIDHTVSELRSNGLLPEAPLEIQKQAVRDELKDKLADLDRRMADPAAIYLDEVDFYNHFFAQNAAGGNA